MGWLLVLGLKECLVECATVCVKSWVILKYGQAKGRWKYWHILSWSHDYVLKVLVKSCGGDFYKIDSEIWVGVGNLEVINFLHILSHRKTYICYNVFGLCIVVYFVTLIALKRYCRKRWVGYSKASRYTASSCTDLAGARFWIGSKKIWDERIYEVKTLSSTVFWSSCLHPIK